MSFKDNGFGDRLATAAEARKAALAKFKAKPGTDDPAVLARQAERRAVQAAREVRTVERQAERARVEEAETAARTEREAREAADEAAREEREAVAAAEAAEREAALGVERKAARDARYAARKARR